MNLNHLSNHELIVSTKVSVKIEKQALVKVLYHLLEIDKRRLHADRGFHSLHEFLVKELGYCDGSAHLRISAMRLMRDLPEVKDHILDSKLTLTTVAQAQNFFQHKEATYSSKSEKLKLLDRLAGKSKEQTKAILFELSPDTQKEMKIEFTGDSEFFDLLNQIKALEGEISVKEIFRRAMKSHIQKIQNKRTESKSKEARAFPEKRGTSSAQTGRTHIPIAKQRQVHQKSQHQCSFVESITHRRCEKKCDLEIEHVIPVAKGGSNHLENLTLLCKTHNRLQAFRHFGKTIMTDRINSSFHPG